jgi:hypothetical protein
VASGFEVSVLPQDYRDLLEVAEDAGRSLRAAQIAATAGLSTDRGNAEALRAKLKRLVERGWLDEEAGRRQSNRYKRIWHVTPTAATQQTHSRHRRLGGPSNRFPGWELTKRGH